VPVMALAGLVVFIVWLLFGRLNQKMSWKNAAVQAVTYAVATLVVPCPCAIGLAVPMVVLIAGGVAARLGIIFRDPSMLETARNVTDVVFDKTVSRIKLLIEPLGGYMIWRHANGAVIFREPSLVDLQSSPTYRTSAITQIKSGAFS
jgi:hypothetical protein